MAKDAEHFTKSYTQGSCYTTEGKFSFKLFFHNYWLLLYLFLLLAYSVYSLCNTLENL